MKVLSHLSSSDTELSPSYQKSQGVINEGGILTGLRVKHICLTSKTSIPLLLALKFLRGTWCWDHLFTLQNFESGCLWESLCSVEERLPWTTCGQRETNFTNRCPFPHSSSAFWCRDQKKPEVCLKDLGIQTKEPSVPPVRLSLCIDRHLHLLLYVGRIIGLIFNLTKGLGVVKEKPIELEEPQIPLFIVHTNL